MPALQRILKKEHELIQQCLELFGAYYHDIESKKPVSPEDLRVAIYALEITLEESSLTQPEARKLYEDVRQYLLEVRLLLEEDSLSSVQSTTLGWKIFELTELLKATLNQVLVMPTAIELPTGIQRDPSQDHLQAPRLIISRLRSAKGLTAA